MLIKPPGGRELTVGEGRTRLMGVLNVTPDSFFDGGRYHAVDAAVARGLSLVEEGADIVDVGGESTRPGYSEVGDREQLRRVLPVIERLRPRVSVPISIDTTRAAVAVCALEAGADWVNDTSALAADPEMAEVVADRGCPVVLMHRFVPPLRPGEPPRGRELVERIAAALAARGEAAAAHGIAEHQVLFDPGIGFGTRPDDGVAMLAHTGPLRRLGRPLCYGPSRKSFLGHVTGRPVGQRLSGTAAAAALLALAGIDIIRIHDVAEIRDVVRLADAVRAERRPSAAAPERGGEWKP